MTNEIVLREQQQLPENIPDLAKFALVGREKLVAVRAEIRAIDKVGLAQEVRRQKLQEAQAISEAVLDAEVRIGELMAKVPKVKNNNPAGKNQHTGQNDIAVDLTTKQNLFEKTKTEIVRESGFTPKQVERFQTLAKHPEIVEQAKAEAREQDDIVSRSAVLKKIKTEERRIASEEKAGRKAFTLMDEMPETVCRLFAADIRNGIAEIEDNSVDFIITDPPYPKEYIPLYANLSELASRVLKPGGSLIVMTGQSYLPEVVANLCTKMRYHWCMAYLTPGGQSPQLFHKRVNTFWKPVLWFVKETYCGDYIGDVLKSQVNDNDKRFHEWGQSFSGMKDIIERCTNPDDLILDPFLGGGTTGVAAVTMGRRFIGTDIGENNIEVSKKRIKEEYANARSQT